MKKKKNDTVVWSTRSSKILKKDLEKLAKKNGMTRNEYVVFHLSSLVHRTMEKKNIIKSWGD